MAGRVANLAPVGSLLAKGTRRPKEAMGGKRPRKRDDLHLSAIRLTGVCLSCGVMTPYLDGAHVRMANAALGKPKTGISEKPDDRWTVPLCPDCHREQHRRGEEVFWQAKGINPILVAYALHNASPDLEAMRRVIIKARGDRP